MGYGELKGTMVTVAVGNEAVRIPAWLMNAGEGGRVVEEGALGHSSRQHRPRHNPKPHPSHHVRPPTRRKHKNNQKHYVHGSGVVVDGLPSASETSAPTVKMPTGLAKMRPEIGSSGTASVTEGGVFPSGVKLPSGLAKMRLA